MEKIEVAKGINMSPKPPYDTKENRARYQIRTEGLITIITRKTSLASLLADFKALLHFKVDKELVRKLWVFFGQVYAVSPLRFNLQVTGKTLER